MKSDRLPKIHAMAWIFHYAVGGKIQADTSFPLAVLQNTFRSTPPEAYQAEPYDIIAPGYAAGNISQYGHYW